MEILFFILWIITIFGVVIFITGWIDKYKDLRLEWEEQNILVDTLTCDRDKYKKEIGYLKEQIDNLVAAHDEETQKMVAKYEKRITDAKAKMKVMQESLDALIVKEADYLTSLEESAHREANLINTVEKLEKDLEKANKKKTRSTSKKKKEENGEQLEIAFEKLEEAIENVDESKGYKVTIDDVDIAAGEGEIKCEKKRRRKKGDSE